MASGFRHPTTTKSGRKVTLSEKARIIMVAEVWKAVCEAAEVLQHSEKELTDAVANRRSRRLVRALYNTWGDLRADLDDLLMEFWDLSSPEESMGKEDELQQLNSRLKGTAGMVQAYLQTEKEVSLQKEEIHRSLHSDAEKVKDEIKKITQQISTLTAQTTAISDPRPSASWQTTSRCSGDTRRVSTAPTAEAVSFAPRRHSSPYVRPSSAPAGDKEKAAGSADLIQQLVTALTEKKDLLPKMEPDVFSGDMLKFPMWLSSFEALIERRTTAPSERLFFLGRYTSGEAHEAIGGYLTLFSDDAYTRAKKLLMSRYGDRLKVAQAYRNRLFSWRPVKKGDGPALQKYSDFLWQCSAAMKSIGHLESLNSAEENAKMVKVLPQHLVEKWFRLVDKWYYRFSDYDDVMEHRVGDDDAMFPPFDEFCRMVATEARILTGPAYNLADQSTAEKPVKTEQKSESRRGGRRAQSFASGAKETTASVAKAAKPKADTGKPVPSCFFCRDAHYLNQCEEFQKLAPLDRKDFALQNHLCFGCLGRGHGYRECKWKNPALLGDRDQAAPEARARTMNTRAQRSAVFSKGACFSMMVPVRVTSPRSPGRSTVVYALLDTQSDTTFVSEELIESMNLKAERVKLRLVTMGAAQTVDSYRVSDVVVESAFGGGKPLQIDECYSRVVIPADEQQKPDMDIASKYPHLKPMLPAMMPRGMSPPISMLIGNDQPSVFVHADQLYEDDDKPYAVKTQLGWSLMGRRSGNEETTRRCFSTSARRVDVGEIAKVFDMNFLDVRGGEEKLSYDDQLFVQRARESLIVKPDGRMEMDLPFRHEPTTLPNNRDVAWKRLMSTKRKMIAKPEYALMYKRFMDELMENDYAELAPSEFVEGQLQFMPHHGVEHPRKPGEIRGVLDAAAEKNGVSLNMMLLPGPDMTNNLVGVLCGFRREKVAFMCDIRKMFMQVGVTPRHRDYLRYLWFDGGDPNAAVVEYRMKVLPFGATSSPACASYALKELAGAHADDFPADVVDFIKKKFYVDDGLGATPTPRETVSLFMRSHELCARGGFWLHKFTSNSEEALRAVPEELLAKNVTRWLLRPDESTMETSLGITWDRLKDVFLFVIDEFRKQLTRRGLLSSLSGIYDPIGFVSPTILKGRLILQELCGQSLPWDQPLSEDYVDRWLAWYEDLKTLSRLTIPRCVRPSASGKLTSAEMHHFCDASSVGYGACSYLKLVDDRGAVDVSLVLAKARVGPRRAVTIPRMELQSAVLATKLAMFLDDQMSYPDLQHWFWTDSMVALGYITNSTKRFHLYVANRVQTIRDRSEPGSWNHVAGELNPADLASRGVTASELVDSRLWWRGPDFLSSRTTAAESFPIADDDPEVKSDVSVALKVQAELEWLDRLAEGCPSYYRLTRRVAVLQKFLLFVTRVTVTPVTAEDLQTASLRLIQLVQRRSFADEYRMLVKARGYPEDREDVHDRNLQLRSGSGLRRLDVFLDRAGTIRIGGRLKRSYLPVDVKHPAVLPRRSRVTWLLVLQHHLRSYHSGRQQTLASLRNSGIWILSSRAAVDELLRACVVCRKMKAAPMTQKMSDLPDCRVKESPPFTYCGVDLFGPVTVKDGRSMKKRWICLVTCMASRAVHLEPVYALSTESFLNALRRVISRRGPITTIFCDRGTNFVGAANDLQSCLKEMDEDRIKQELMKSGCDWTDFRFNPPTASHMGGVWERMVKSAKAVYLQLLAQFGEWVSDEMLWTITAEVEGTLNNRPITCVDVLDPWSEPPLTPARLLTQKTVGMTSPPGRFEDVETYGRKAWRRVQSIADRFWRQWRNEFLPDLQLRRKWNNRQYNLKVGDIVLMIDKDVKRNRWPIARVEETLPSADGLVRAVRLRVGHTFLERPIAKLIFLCEGQE